MTARAYPLLASSDCAATLAFYEGLGFRARSGTPTSYLGSHPRYGVDEAFIVPRGIGPRTAGSWSSHGPPSGGVPTARP